MAEEWNEMTKVDSADFPNGALAATGQVFLAAASADGAEDSGANRKMRIAAYNGGLIDVGWGRPVGIEVAGLSWREDSAIPILCLHDAYSLDAICGQATRITRDGRSLSLEADLMPVSESAKKIHALAKAGFRFQASVGVTPKEVFRVGEDESATLNGDEVSGPCYIVRAGTLNEVSIVPIGADGSTQTAIAAAAQTHKEGIMPEDKKKPAGAAEPTDAATVEAAQNAERERVAAVIAACKGHEDIMAEAVRDGWTAEHAELACLKAEKAAAEKARIEAGRAAAPSIIDLRASAPKDAKTVAAAACMGAAMPDSTVEAQFKGVDLDAAHDLGVTRLSDIFAAFGYEYRPGNGASMEKALRAAFSNADIPNVLSNVAHKFVLAGFGAVGEDWRKVSRAVPVKDFKAVKGVRLVMGGVLKPLAKGGELQHVSLSDESSDLAAATKGSIVGITREDLINDDLGILSKIPERFGQMAGRTINKDVFGAISRKAGDYGANTSGALSVANLATAYQLALGITDKNGDYLGAMPNVILASPSNYMTALNIYQSEQIIGTSSEKGKNNVMRGLLAPITSQFLGSGTAYWLFNSAFPLVDVAFLNGRTTPIVETAEADFSQLGIQMRCYFDYGAAAGELKAALYSTGA